jgi:hypothetical protein
MNLIDLDLPVRHNPIGLSYAFEGALTASKHRTFS